MLAGLFALAQSTVPVNTEVRPNTTALAALAFTIRAVGNG